MENKIKINDLVFAKLATFPPWPSLVIEPTPNAPKKPAPKHTGAAVHWVYFFGSHDYAWVEECHLKPYADYKDKYVALYKTRPFKEAVEETDNVLAELEKDKTYKVPLHPLKVITRKRPKSLTKTGSASEPLQLLQAKTKTDLKRSLKRTKNSGPASKRPKSSASLVVENEEANTDTELSTTSTSTYSQNSFSPKRLKTKNVATSDLTFGVLGIGIIGSGIVKNLIRSGHKVNIWNRTSKKCTDVEAELGSNREGYLKTHLNPRSVMQHSDIVFNCFSDQEVSKKIIQNYFGINNSTDNILNEKGFVEVTSIDPETSKDLRDMIEKKGGRYLEVQVQGSKMEATDGSLVVLSAGNKSLFFDCQSCFKAMGKSAIYLGDVGYATKVNLILQLIRGVCVVGLAEGLALAERCGVSLEEFLNVFNLTSLASTYLMGKAHIIIEKSFKNVEQSLQNMQKDMKLGLELSNRMGQPMELASIANEIFKHCCKFDFGSQDASAIFMRTRF